MNELASDREPTESAIYSVWHFPRDMDLNCVEQYVQYDRARTHNIVPIQVDPGRVGEFHVRFESKPPGCHEER